MNSLSKVFFGFACLSLVATGACAAAWGFSYSVKTVIAISPNGAVHTTNESTQSRATAEQMARMWDRWGNDTDIEVDEDEEAAQPKKPSTPKPFTDAELTEKLRASFQKMPEAYGGSGEMSVDRIEVTSNIVHTIVSQSYSNLDEFVGTGANIFAQAGVASDDVRFQATNGEFRITFVPNSSPQMKRYAKTARQQWKTSGVTNELRLILPGKIASSVFPGVEGNTTWIQIDGSDKAIDTMMKMYDGPTVIVADLGGLKLDHELSLKSARRHRGQRDPDADVAITDAGPGYVAEPLMVTTTTSYTFPGGEKYLGDAIRYSGQPTGTVVQAKLFPPKGRSILKVSGIKVLKAVDDRNRTISEAREDEDEEVSGYTSYSGDSNERGSYPVALRFAVPPADAQVISEVRAQLVATTVGKWNEQTVTNVTQSTNEIDLASVLPGARLVIKKLANKNKGRQITIEAELKGPPQISQIDFKYLKGDGDESGRGSSSAYTRRNGKSGALSTRTVQITHYNFEESASPGPGALRVRYPADLKRERVQIKLANLDLF